MVEQKADETRRKFVEDHQLIHYRKKNEPSIPFLPGHDQEMWFTKLESNNIWKWVFEYLTNPLDLTSAYFSSEMFRKHLGEKRKMMLLPQVFEVLRDQRYLHYSTPTSMSGVASNEDMEERREVLKLRHVSKSWKKWAEEAFLIPLQVSPSQPIWHPDSWDWSSPMVTWFTRIEQIENAVEKLQNPNSRAAILRLVLVNDRPCKDDNKEIFHSKLVEFLDIHGGSVLALRFENDRLDYGKLCQVVSRMPHLKVLELRYDWSHCMWEFFRRDAYEELRQSIAQTPFPILPELEFCFLKNYPRVTECLVAEILRKSTNLKAVHLDHHRGNSRDSVISPMVWDALRDLRLECFNLEYDSYGDHFMEEFSKLEQCNWPLKFLHIYLYTDHDFYTFEIDGNCAEFLRVMSSFNDSLEKFQFRVSYGTLNLMNDERSTVVDFPKLKELALSNSIIIQNA